MNVFKNFFECVFLALVVGKFTSSLSLFEKIENVNRGLSEVNFTHIQIVHIILIH